MSPSRQRFTRRVTFSARLKSDDAKFVRLQNELVDNLENLFVFVLFVLHPEVEATNNRSERQARSEAMARQAARPSKTASGSGAKRRGVIMSVLASLSKRVERKGNLADDSCGGKTARHETLGHRKARWQAKVRPRRLSLPSIPI